MRSKVAAHVADRRRARILAMTPAERIALALRLEEEGIQSHMTMRDVDRATAIREIKATRRLGRRPSRSADAD